MRAKPLLRTLLRPLGDRAGIALPLALAALLAVSLLLTAALIAATVEMSLSRAHRDGVRGLYQAEGAVESYLGGGAPLAPGVVEVALHGAPPSYRLRIARLYRAPRRVTNDSVSREETFSLVAEPLTRGRRVGALAASIARLPLPPLSIDAAAVSGGAVHLTGASSALAAWAPACGPDSAGVAVTLPETAELTAAAGAAEPGAVERHALHGEAFQRAVLGGATLAGLAAHPTISLSGAGTLSGPNTSHSVTGADSLYNWGCPPALGVVCAAADTARLPVIVIDAAGGTARVAGGYGQGVLLVRGGALELEGAFHFAGLVAAEGGVRVVPGASVQIDGALAAFGASGLDLAGAEVRFSRCALRRARLALAEGALNAAPGRVEHAAFGWFEVTY